MKINEETTISEEQVLFNKLSYEEQQFILKQMRMLQPCELECKKEEEKKIPEKLDIRQEKNIKNNWKWKVYGKEHSYNISTPQKIIADKLNEVLDYLQSKGE